MIGKIPLNILIIGSRRTGKTELVLDILGSNDAKIVCKNEHEWKLKCGNKVEFLKPDEINDVSKCADSTIIIDDYNIYSKTMLQAVVQSRHMGTDLIISSQLFNISKKIYLNMDIVVFFFRNIYTLPERKEIYTRYFSSLLTFEEFSYTIDELDVHDCVIISMNPCFHCFWIHNTRKIQSRV